MQRILLYSLLFIGQLVLGQNQPNAYDEMLNEYYKRTVPFIQPDQLNKKMNANEKILLLDTREKGEFAVSSLKGAINVGFLSFSKSQVDAVDKSTLIVVYCTIGARSETIGEKLIKLGFTNVYNLYGGIILWKNQGYPVYLKDKPTEFVHVYSKKWGAWLTNGKPKY